MDRSQLQWGSENRTCPVLKWSTLGRFSNGQPFFCLPRSFYILRKRPDFECFRFSNGPISGPHCSCIRHSMFYFPVGIQIFWG